MTINSNEEYLPVGSQKSISSPYYMVSCRSNDTELVCITESEKNAIRFSFPNYVAFRITLSAYRDFDMRNRFCDHLMYEINNSFYLEQVGSLHKNVDIKNYHHFLLNLDDTVVDVIVSGDIIITVANGLNKAEDDINDDILFVEKIKLNAAQSGHSHYYDLFEQAKHKEVYVPVENIFGDFMLTSSNYGGVDFLLSIKPVNCNKEGKTIVFPEILCIKETSLLHHNIDEKKLKPNNLPEPVFCEVRNSNFIEWIAYAGYRQLYGEPKDLRHIRINLHNMIYDVILDSKGERPYFIKGNT